MKRHFINSLRLCRIAWVLARNDALFPLERTHISPIITKSVKLLARRKNSERPGIRLSRALQELGPTFIKLGQSFSTRSDLVGDEIAADLANLRDNLPAFPTKEVYGILEEEFDRPYTKLFRTFDEKPVAAASIAQVHFATTMDGKEVAVKILRPDVHKAFERDLELFFWIAELVEQTMPELRRLKPLKVVETFEESIQMELDLRYEAASALELRHNMEQDEAFYVPSIHWPLTSQRVMTMERIQGTNISHTDKLRDKGFDLDKLLQIASESFFNMVYRDGFFHADLHPGNLFVLDDGRLAVVDFGIMGRISREERIYLIEILRGFLKADYRHVAEVHFAAGYVPANKSVDNFALACMAIGHPILNKPLDEISIAKLLAQLFKVAETFEMETQPQLLLLQKTMMVAEGVGRMLNPHVNMWKLAEPLVTDWAKQHLGPLAKLQQGLHDLELIARKLPETLYKVEHLLTKVEEGGIPLHPETTRALIAERRRQHTDWLILMLGLALVTLSLHYLT